MHRCEKTQIRLCSIDLVLTADRWNSLYLLQSGAVQSGYHFQIAVSTSTHPENSVQDCSAVADNDCAVDMPRLEACVRFASLFVILLLNRHDQQLMLNL